MLGAAAALVLTGCLGKEEQRPFKIADAKIYVVQKYDGDIPSFTPYGFLTGSLALSDASISYGIAPFMPGISYSYYSYEARAYAVSSLGLLKGTYRFTAKDNYNNTAIKDIELDLDDSKMLGQMNVNAFSYEDGVLSADVDKVTNASSYGFFLRPEFENDEDGFNEWARMQGIGIYSTASYDDGAVFSLPVPSTTYDSYRVSVVACYSSEKGNIYLHSPEKRLRRYSDELEDL